MNKVILVNSHRRSGTHYLIDSLRLNIPGARFPNHWKLPADLNLGSLYSKKEQVYEIFRKFLYMDATLIIKSHLLPEECELLTPKDKYEEMISTIFREAEKLYVYRDGQDTLISLYHFLSPGTDFSSFLRSTNDHIVKKIRNEQSFDRNRVAYWAYHVEQWLMRKDTLSIPYSVLKDDFVSVIHNLMTYMNCSIPEAIREPKIPRNKIWHSIRKKLHHFGMFKLPESSSVRPRIGKQGTGKDFFTENDVHFFNDNAGDVISLMEDR